MLLNNEFLHYSFLYSTNKNFDNVFRFIISLKNQVNDTALKRAVIKTFKRYPYFTVKLTASNNTYDVVFNDNPIVVTNGEKPICLGTKEANYHYISIGYNNKNIYIDVYHSLTDAGGITPLAKTLMYYYHFETTGEYPDKTDILTIDDPISPEEYKNPVEDIKEYPDKPDYEYHEIKAYNLGARDYDTPNEKKIYLITISEDQFADYAKAHKGSINTTIATLFTIAVNQCVSTTERNSQPIVPGIAMSTKKLIGAENSYANMVALANIEFDSIDGLSIENLNEEGRIQLKKQTELQNILYSIKSRPNLVAYLKNLPNDDERKDLYYKMILRMKARNSFFVSYLGKQNWKALENDIDSIFVVSEADNHSMEINLYAVNGKFCIAMAQNFGTSKYIKAFLSVLDNENIHYQLEGFNDIILPSVKTTEIFC